MSRSRPGIKPRWSGVSFRRLILWRLNFIGRHEDGIFEVLEGKADIGAGKNPVLQRLAETDGRLVKELLILERYPDAPENSLALRKKLDDSWKKKKIPC